MEGVKLLHDNIAESSNVSWNISVEYWNVLRNVLAMSYESFFYGLSLFQSTLNSTVLDVSGSSGHHLHNFCDFA